MRFVGLLALALSLSVLSVPASSGPNTLTFDRLAIRQAPTFVEISHVGFQPAAIGNNLLACSKNYYVKLSDCETPEMLDVTVVEKEPLLWDGREVLGGELPTAVDSTYLDFAASSARLNRIGMDPVVAGREVTVNAERYLTMTVFPVTVDDSGRAFFNRIIRIAIKDRVILEHELLTDPDVSRLTVKNEPPFGFLTASAGDPIYVIITSEALMSACEELAVYRTATGFGTDLVTIEEILSTYDGLDDAERLREYLKDFHEDGGRYVLLAGDETVLPVRYACYRDIRVPPRPDRLIPCDLYFADLTGQWDADADGYWGEPHDDAADLTPELLVGRLPFSSQQAISSYVRKLINYETAPGNGDPSYLNRAFFYCSDQMRDYNDHGQHARVAAAFPGSFVIDTSRGVELTSGDDPTPYNSTAYETATELSLGHGVINIIAHGSYDCFAVRTSAYNDWPKSIFYSHVAGSGNAGWDVLSPNGRTSFYYSLACDNGAYDKDQPPFGAGGANFVAAGLAAEDAGAIGFVAYTRWGWVSSSYLYQEAFYDSLFAHPDRPAVGAMHASHKVYPLYIDLVYGQAFFGDPSLKVYTQVPRVLCLDPASDTDRIQVLVTDNDVPVEGCLVVLSTGRRLIAQRLTGPDGLVSFTHPLQADSSYTLAAVKTGFTVARRHLAPTVITDVNDDEQTLPVTWTLQQNYPNPFNPSTTISFDVARSSTVTLDVYNVTGQHVAALANQLLPAGRHQVTWSGRNDAGDPVASGVYFYRIRAEGFTDVRKMTLIK